MLRRTVITKLAATLVIPLATYLFGKGYLRLASIVGIPSHTIPCPLCHGSRAFAAFYSCDFARSAQENLFVAASLFVCNAIPAFVAGAIAVGKFNQLESLCRRNLTWSHEFVILAASAALFAAQWLINIYRLAK